MVQILGNSASSAIVWLLDSRHSDAQLRADWLSGGEAVRYAGFLRPERQRQYVLGRVLARQAIGALLGIDARSVVLDGGAGRAPIMTTPVVPTLSFSISHSRHWIACAVSGDTAVGLDIEVRDAGRDVLALAEHGFSSQQFEAIRRLAPDERLDGFYALWCAQEAQIKLGGQGRFCLQLDHPELAVALCSAHKLDRVNIELSG